MGSEAPVNDGRRSNTSSKTGKIALVQYDADAYFGETRFNLRQLGSFADAAVKQGAGIIVFPEGAIHGYRGSNATWSIDEKTTIQNRIGRSVEAVAEIIPGGPVCDLWGKYASAHGVYVVFNLIEADGNQFFNTSVVAGPVGYINKYRKRLLYVYDKLYAKPGAAPAAFSTPYGKFGLLTCMDGQDHDNFFFTEYKKLGVNAVILPMDWDDCPFGEKSARRTFTRKAKMHGIDIFAADMSPWDGTGRYTPYGKRLRNSLPQNAVGSNGISYHALRYEKKIL